MCAHVGFCYPRDNSPARAGWVEEWCGHLRATSCIRNLLQPDHNWHHSIHLKKQVHHKYYSQGVHSVEIHTVFLQFQYPDFYSSVRNAPPRWHCWVHRQPSEYMPQGKGPTTCVHKRRRERIINLTCNWQCRHKFSTARFRSVRNRHTRTERLSAQLSSFRSKRHQSGPSPPGMATQHQSEAALKSKAVVDHIRLLRTPGADNGRVKTTFLNLSLTLLFRGVFKVMWAGLPRSKNVCTMVLTYACSSVSRMETSLAASSWQRLVAV